MTEGRQKTAWGRTSHLMAMIYNMHRSPKMPYKAADSFNPMIPAPTREQQKLPLSNEEAFALLKRTMVK